MYLEDLKGSSTKDFCWEVQQCLQFVAVFENVQEDPWVGFFYFFYLSLLKEYPSAATELASLDDS